MLVIVTLKNHRIVMRRGILSYNTATRSIQCKDLQILYKKNKQTNAGPTHTRSSSMTLSTKTTF